MKRISRAAPLPTPFTLPTMMFELALASWETIARRSLMMAQGTCSLAEYQRMVMEKSHAAQHSALALMVPDENQMENILAPWHRGATANVRRLRRKAG